MSSFVYASDSKQQDNVNQDANAQGDPAVTDISIGETWDHKYCDTRKGLHAMLEKKSAMYRRATSCTACTTTCAAVQKSYQGFAMVQVAHNGHIPDQLRVLHQA